MTTRARAPQVLVTTSWDDGHVDDARLADLLTRTGVSATFYVALRNREIPTARRLAPSAVRELGERFEIGSHTTTHPVLTEVDLATAREEIAGSRAELSDLLGRDVTTFCYPRGAWSPTVRDLVADAGYRYARTVAAGWDGAVARVGADPFTTATTIEAARPPLWRVPTEPVRAAVALRVPPHRTTTWADRALAVFERVRTTGGVFHLWGHSWVTSARGEWAALERVLAHVGGTPGVEFVPNSALAGHGARSGR